MILYTTFCTSVTLWLSFPCAVAQLPQGLRLKLLGTCFAGSLVGQVSRSGCRAKPRRGCRTEPRQGVRRGRTVLGLVGNIVLLLSSLQKCRDLTGFGLFIQYPSLHDLLLFITNLLKFYRALDADQEYARLQSENHFRLYSKLHRENV